MLQTKYVFLIFLILTFAVAQGEQQQNFEQPQPQVDYQTQLRQQASMKRTACLVLSRYHTNAHKQLLDQIIGSLRPEEQQPYINKMYAVAIQKCMPVIAIEQAYQFFQEQPNFDPSTLFYILDGFDYNGIAHDIDNLTPNQKNLIKFIKQFDEEMQIKKQERQAQKDQVQEEDDIGIFGISVTKFNSPAGYVYIIIFASILIGGFIWGFSQLNNSSIPSKKKKSSKSARKQS